MCVFLMLDVEEQCPDVARNGWSSVSYSVCRYVESAQRPDRAEFLASQMAIALVGGARKLFILSDVATDYHSIQFVDPLKPKLHHLSAAAFTV